jgi:hypothetical protein
LSCTSKFLTFALGAISFGALIFLNTAPIQAQLLPSVNIPSNSWVEVHPTFVGVPNGGQLFPQGWGNKGTYDPVTHRVILSDRWEDPIRGFISIFANGIYAYDPALNTFTVLKLNNWYARTNPDGGYTTLPLPANATDPTPPDHHPLTSLEVVPSQNAVYTVNGVNSISLPDPSILNKTWKMNLSTNSWTMVSSAGTDPNYPPNNISSTSGLIYDPVIQKLVYLVPSYCGCNGTAAYLFDPVSNRWAIQPQDPSSLNVYVAGAGVTYDSKRGLVMAYGGNQYSTANPTAHLWAYSAAQNKWTQLGDAPVTAQAPGFAYDSKHDVFLALVGNYTYIYNPNTRIWSRSPAVLNRPSSMQAWQGITYDPAYDVFVFEGGNWSNPLIALFRYDPGSSPPPGGPILQLHNDASEVSGLTNGSIVTPSTAPAGFKGTVVVNGTGSVNFTPAKVGNGVFFLNCCANTNTAYYKFTGTTIGNIFNLNQGQASFFLKSRYTFAQRQTLRASPRMAFDVRDANGHLFYFLTEISFGRLVFSYTVGGAAQFYYVPQGTEDALFGNGAILKVTMKWDGSLSKLYLNDVLSNRQRTRSLRRTGPRLPLSTWEHTNI